MSASWETHFTNSTSGQTPGAPLRRSSPLRRLARQGARWTPRSTLKSRRGGNRAHPLGEEGTARALPRRRETPGGIDAARVAVNRHGTASKGETGTSLLAPPSFRREAGESGRRMYLEGGQSPWEERAIHRWKRRRVATDSSVEKIPGIAMSAGAVLTSTFGYGCRGRYRRLQRECASVAPGSPGATARAQLQPGLSSVHFGERAGVSMK